jgi:RNase H-fold protein (predicted Holliday junction resolvase)
VDPGRDKCGVACLTDDGAIVCRSIVAPSDVVAWVLNVQGSAPVRVVVGNGTGHARLVAMLQAAGIEPELVDERNTSAEARRRYLLEHPGRGWRRLVPLGLRTPDAPYDDYVAVILAERTLCDFS